MGRIVVKFVALVVAFFAVVFLFFGLVWTEWVQALVGIALALAALAIWGLGDRSEDRST